MAESGLPAFAHSRLIGNRLRELDRFLSVLVEESALLVQAPDHDAHHFGRLRNTPNKLRMLDAMMGRSSDHHDRLRAIGRIGACLHHCAGTVHMPGLYRDVGIAGGYPADREDAGSGPAVLHLAPKTIVSICELYQMIGDRLVADSREKALRLDFPAREAHIRTANVACDGI